MLEALVDTPVPIPRVHCHCTDTEVIGTEFYVIEFLDRAILWDPLCPGSHPGTVARSTIRS